MKNRVLLLTGILLICLCAVESHAAPQVDYGDMKSSTLTASGWNALGNKNYEAVVALASKCIDTYKTTALQQQKAAATGKPNDKGTWALNDVAASYYMRAQAYEGLNKMAEAIADYKYLSENLSAAALSGDNGTTWNPAKPAQERAIILAATTHQEHTISKIDSSSLIVKTPTAITTYRINAKTQIEFKGKPAKLSDLKTGMRVEVTAGTDPQVAERINADDPPRK
jgi:hypothetical protein